MSAIGLVASPAGIERAPHAYRDPWRRRICRLADLPASVRGGARDPYRRQPEPALDRHRTGGAVADADGFDPGALPDLARPHRPAAAFPPAGRGQGIRAAEGLAGRTSPRGGDPFRRAARRALFDEDRPAQGLYRHQQRQRHAQPAGGAGGNRHRRASAASGHHGGLWLFQRRCADPRRLSGRHHRHASRAEAAADPLSDPARAASIT